MKKFLVFCKSLPQYASKIWFPYVMAITAFSDYFIFVIPLDAIVVASVIAARRRWISITLWSSFGSTCGAIIFAALIQHFGVSFLSALAPHLLEGGFAVTLTNWLQNYGFWALLLLAASPINQHPIVAIAALAKVSLFTIFITMFLGRFLKYCLYTWLTTHAKKGIERFFKE